MRIRQRWPSSSSSPLLPPPSNHQPSEALLERIRDLSYRFRQRFRQPPAPNPHPAMEETAGQGNDEEEESKKEDSIKPNPNQPDQQDAPEREEEEEDRTHEEKVTRIENGTTRIGRKGKDKNSSSEPSCRQDRRWLEGEKSFPIKKRRGGLSWGSDVGAKASGDKNMGMKSTLRKRMITQNPNDGEEDDDADEKLDVNDKEDGDADKKLGGNDIGDANDAAIKGINGDGIGSMEDNETTKKPQDKNKVLPKASARRASIVIEGMQMTSKAIKSDENPVHVNSCTIAKKRGKIPSEPNDKEGDDPVEKVQVGVPKKLITNRRRRAPTKTSDEGGGEDGGGGGKVVGRRGRKRQAVDKSGIEEQKEQWAVTRSVVTADGGGSAVTQGSRCSRYNGRGWRCRQITLAGYSLCEHHLGKGRMKNMSSVGKSSATSRIPPQPRKHGCDEGQRKSLSPASPAPSAANSSRKGKEALVEGEMRKKKRGLEAFFFSNH